MNEVDNSSFKNINELNLKTCKFHLLYFKCFVWCMDVM